MKKTMIIALLAVLVLGAFTACNGDVNAELAGGKRVIYLELDATSKDYYKFDDGKTTKEVEIPSNCNTWGEFVATEYQINVYENTDVYQFVSNLDSESRVLFTSSSAYNYSYPTGLKSAAGVIPATTPISIGGTYYFRVCISH